MPAILAAFCLWCVSRNGIADFFLYATFPQSILEGVPEAMKDLQLIKATLLPCIAAPPL